MKEAKSIGVRLEGTITEGGDPDVLDFGTVRPEARVRLAALALAGHRIIVLSASAKYPTAVRRLWNFLVHERVDFTDVWCGEGLPSVDVFVDDAAVKLENV